MTVPLLLQFVSTIYKWIRIEKYEDKKWSWIFLILQLWPQLRAIRVIRLFYNNNPKANDEKKEYNVEVGCTEPFLEAWPSFIIMTIIWIHSGFELFHGKDNSQLGANGEAVFGSSTVSTTSLARFFISYAISAFTCCFGITKMLQTGPCPVLSEEGIFGGLLNYSFIIHFLGVMFSTLTKGLCIGFVIGINSDRYHRLHSLYGYDLFGGQWITSLNGYNALLFIFLPNLILAFISIAKSTGLSKNFFEVVLRYPALLLLPVATYFVIGPQDVAVANCLCNNQSVNLQHLGVSGRLTAFNLAFTFGLYILTILLGFPMDWYIQSYIIIGPSYFFTPFVLVLALGWIFTGLSFKSSCCPNQYKMINHYIYVDRDRNQIQIRQKDVEKELRSQNNLT